MVDVVGFPFQVLLFCCFALSNFEDTDIIPNEPNMFFWVENIGMKHG